LEQVVRSQPYELSEVRFTLAQLYLCEHDWAKASKQMRALLAIHGTEMRFPMTYAAMLIDHNEIKEAELWLRHLQELGLENSLSIMLQTELLVRRGQVDQAIDVLHTFLAHPASPEPTTDQMAEHEARILKVVSILKETAIRSALRGDKAVRTRLLAEMEILVRDYVTRHPSESFRLAFTLLQQDRVDEALGFAEESWPKADVSALATELEALSANPGLNPEQSERLERIMLSVADKNGRPVQILLFIANLKMGQHPPVAVEIFREVLKKDGNNVAALGNLAALLALQKQSAQEALRLVGRAIEIVGPLPAQLDIRARVLMASGRLQAAVADLDEAISDGPQPCHYFHRALAHWRLGQQTAAREDFQQARKMGLKPEDLLEFERADYNGLASKLAP